VDHRAPRTSELIAALPDSFAGETLMLGELIKALRNRVFGLGILLFSIPNIFPMPPGVPAAMGAVLMLLGAQLALGNNTIWMPKRLAQRSISRSTLRRIADKSVPWIQRFERISKPRLDMFTSPIGARVVGAAVFVLGLVLLLPFPFLGNIPPGAAACILGLGLVERDGVLVAGGYVAAALALGITWLATYLLFEGALAIF
jgi:hypothetical protein